MKLANQKEVSKVTESTIKKIVNNESLSKSKKMVELFLLGIEVKEIANIMNVRYNFVYNVVSNYSIVNSIEVETNKKEVKKDIIVALLKEGKTPKEVAIETKSNINYVYTIQKEVKNKKEETNE
jgi:DNA invertase Pin-like site-specific DNA recombinase